MSVPSVMHAQWGPLVLRHTHCTVTRARLPPEATVAGRALAVGPVPVQWVSRRLPRAASLPPPHLTAHINGLAQAPAGHQESSNI